MSTTTISEYANNALLSEAAYADFSAVFKDGISDKDKEKATIDALIAIKFSETQAADFVSKYNVVC